MTNPTFLVRLAVLLALLGATLPAWAQPIPISQARSRALGTSVTITGVVTNGSELGSIRYLQDSTGALAAYGASQVSNISRGDSIVVTGVLKNYQNLLELDPVTSVTVVASGKALPAPVVLTPSQLGETYEGQLVRINDATFDLGGSTFGGNTSYTFTAGGQQGTVYIRSNHPLVGSIVPSGTVAIIGVLSQFQSTYQILPRDGDDFIYSSALFLTQLPTATNINTSGFTLTWATNVAANATVRYGKTPALELGTVSGSSGSATNSVSITGLNASDIVYAQCVSRAGADSAITPVRVYATQSTSSGKMLAYFTKPVDVSVASMPANEAKALIRTVDDTLIAYIGRAKQTIDFAIYNLNNQGLTDITLALNAAAARGVNVRVIYCTSTNNFGVNYLDASIPKLESPNDSDHNIMHNKFVVFDAGSADDAIVWTGSTNMTDGQVNDDPNNVIIIHDQSLAKAYTLEFEEMWGDTDNTPNPAASRFGPFKTDNTPHEFNIGGNRVECYFSPSDNVNQQIIRTVNTANDNLFMASLILTRTDIANAIANLSSRGVNVFWITDDTSAAAQTPWRTLRSRYGASQVLYYNQSGIFHHKYIVVDPNNTSSDPLVLTGSHNFSTSANTINDENTVIVHNADIANQYFQEFNQRFKEVSAATGVGPSAVSSFGVFPNPTTGRLHLTLAPTAPLSLLLLDVQGRALAQTDLQPGQTAFDLPAHLPAGVYILTATDGNTTVSQRVVVAR